MFLNERKGEVSMTGKRKVITILLICIFAAAGGGITYLNSKFARQDTVNLIFAATPGEAVREGAATFKELCEKYSDGKITVDVFEDNILGDDKLVIEGAQVGDIDIAMSSTSPIAVMYHDYYLFDAPYMFLNAEEVYQVGFAGEKGRKIMDGVNKIGLKGLAMWENGFRNLTNDSRLVTEPEQLKGMKIRTMENSIHLKAWRALGSNPTPMAFTELFTALQQKTVDGQENPIGLIESNKFYEVQKYISLTQHIYTPYCVVMNLEKWNALTKEQQQIIDRAMQEAAKAQIETSQAFENKAIQLMQDYGCTVLDLSDEEKKAFQKIIVDAGVHDMVKQNMEHPDYFDDMTKELEEFREE